MDHATIYLALPTEVGWGLWLFLVCSLENHLLQFLIFICTLESLSSGSCCLSPPSHPLSTPKLSQSTQTASLGIRLGSCWAPNLSPPSRFVPSKAPQKALWYHGNTPLTPRRFGKTDVSHWSSWRLTSQLCSPGLLFIPSCFLVLLNSTNHFTSWGLCVKVLLT